LKIDISAATKKEGNMKFRGFGWGMICFIALSLLTFSGQVNPTDKPPGPAQIKLEQIGPVQLSPGIKKDWVGLDRLAEKINEDIKVLEAAFSGQAFGKMAERLQLRHAVVAGKDYEMTYGRASESFWKSAYSEGASLQIKVAMVYVSNVMGPHPLLPFPEENKVILPKAFNAVAFVAEEFHIITKTKKGAVLHNDTYFCDLGYRHQWECQWGN
jgi:hypothetical protein